MAPEQEDSGKSVALAVAALFVEMSDKEVWDAMDAEHASIIEALEEGRIADAGRHVDRVAALTAEAGRRARDAA